MASGCAAHLAPTKIHDPSRTLPPPHPVLPGADPSPPGQPQEQAPMDGPHAKVGLKPQLSSRNRVTKEEDQKSPHWM